MMRNLLLLTFFSSLFFSCTIRERQPQDAVETNAYASQEQLIREGMSLLQDGDLLVRTGTELSSQMIRQLNRKDQTYSHSGIVFLDKGYPYVYHIVTGDENPDGKLKKDSIESFCNPRRNSAFAIYRFDLDKEENQQFRDLVRQWHREGVKFDSLFNLGTDEKMYCSEMIKKGLERSTGGRITIPTMRANEKEARFFSRYVELTPEQILRLDLVTVDLLYLNPGCRLIKKFQFNQP